MKRDPIILLSDIVESIEKILQFVGNKDYAQFSEDDLIFNAVIIADCKYIAVSYIAKCD